MVLIIDEADWKRLTGLVERELAVLRDATENPDLNDSVLAACSEAQEAWGLLFCRLQDAATEAGYRDAGPAAAVAVPAPELLAESAPEVQF
jgi:hypothetical protein